MVLTPSAVSIKNVVPIAVTVLIVVLEKRILKMFTKHYVKKLRLETNTKKLTSNSFSTRRPLGPKRGSGAGIACRVNAKRNPDILKYSLLTESNFLMAPIGQLWQSCSIFYFQLLISHGILK